MKKSGSEINKEQLKKKKVYNNTDDKILKNSKKLLNNSEKIEISKINEISINKIMLKMTNEKIFEYWKKMKKK